MQSEVKLNLNEKGIAVSGTSNPRKQSDQCETTSNFRKQQQYARDRAVSPHQQAANSVEQLLESDAPFKIFNQLNSYESVVEDFCFKPTQMNFTELACEGEQAGEDTIIYHAFVRERAVQRKNDGSWVHLSNSHFPKSNELTSNSSIFKKSLITVIQHKLYLLEIISQNQPDFDEHREEDSSEEEIEEQRAENIEPHESEQSPNKHLEKDGELIGASNTLFDATHELDISMAYIKICKHRIHNATELFESAFKSLGSSHQKLNEEIVKNGGMVTLLRFEKQSNPSNPTTVKKIIEIVPLSQWNPNNGDLQISTFLQKIDEVESKKCCPSSLDNNICKDNEAKNVQQQFDATKNTIQYPYLQYQTLLTEELGELLNPFVIQFNILSKYTLDNQIGEGSQAKVFSAVSSGNQKSYAIKVVSVQKLQENPTTLEYFKNEIVAMQNLAFSDGIVKLRGVFEDRLFIYLVQDLADGGTLLDMVKKQNVLKESHAKQVISRLLETVSQMHAFGYIHRDIKLENILVKKNADGDIQTRQSPINEGEFEKHAPSGDEQIYNQNKGITFEVLIGDLGLIGRVPSDPTDSLYEICGSPTYVAPEILSKAGYREKVDVFSLGSLLFNLLSGRYLFSGADETTLLKQNIKCDLSNIKRYLDKVSHDAATFLSKLLEKDPSKRLSAVEALQDPWLATGGLDQNVLKERKCNVSKKLSLIQPRLIASSNLAQGQNALSLAHLSALGGRKSSRKVVFEVRQRRQSHNIARLIQQSQVSDISLPKLGEGFLKNCKPLYCRANVGLELFLKEIECNDLDKAPISSLFENSRQHRNGRSNTKAQNQEPRQYQNSRDDQPQLYMSAQSLNKRHKTTRLNGQDITPALVQSVREPSMPTANGLKFNLRKSSLAVGALCINGGEIPSSLNQQIFQYGSNTNNYQPFAGTVGLNIVRDQSRGAQQRLAETIQKQQDMVSNQSSRALQKFNIFNPGSHSNSGFKNIEQNSASAFKSGIEGLHANNIFQDSTTLKAPQLHKGGRPAPLNIQYLSTNQVNQAPSPLPFFFQHQKPYRITRSPSPQQDSKPVAASAINNETCDQTIIFGFNDLQSHKFNKESVIGLAAANRLNAEIVFRENVSKEEKMKGEEEKKEEPLSLSPPHQKEVQPKEMTMQVNVEMSIKQEIAESRNYNVPEDPSQLQLIIKGEQIQQVTEQSGSNQKQMADPPSQLASSNLLQLPPRDRSQRQQYPQVGVLIDEGNQFNSSKINERSFMNEDEEGNEFYGLDECSIYDEFISELSCAIPGKINQINDAASNLASLNKLGMSDRNMPALKRTILF
ncbi:hypothetical protein FGO68_gene10345 [Halteria grandinella]|uniref:Protein kinase domain-containing protein n=1 Tax=Halteria grandinella TaxID=5974 RepID=A0A8J8P269_HALGN|nr:hypothetical protein FGO68_gene10345 [Halteria grandinella]